MLQFVQIMIKGKTLTISQRAI